MPGRDTTGFGSGTKIQALSRTAFCVSDRDSDIRPSGEMGHFHRDTRHLSRLEVSVNGESPSLLSCYSADDGAAFFLVSDALSVMRKRKLPAYSGGLVEEIRLENHAREEREIALGIRLDADFADLFEVRGIVPTKRREIAHEIEGDKLIFVYEREDFRRETRISLETDGKVEVSSSGLSVVVTLPPHSARTVTLNVEVASGGVVPDGVAGSEPSRYVRLATGLDPLQRLWDKSLSDLESLRFRPDTDETFEVYAAGIPWYAALFGRDPLITCYQTLPLGPERTMETLRLLAKYQGREVNAFRDEEPGKVLHELRLGEAAHFGEVPFSPYYGTADATPLFLVVLHELWRWTGDADFIREIEPHARRALGWMESYGDSDGDGYIDYSPNPVGLVNQGWKDSEDSLLFRDGTFAEPPIALCEVQGYAFDAYIRTAELAEKVWGDEGLARNLRDRAADLAARFDRDFWMENRGCYALAGGGRRVDSVTSNAGHLLWSGIVRRERAGALARTLMSPESFSGWGIRTMAATEGGYDPVSYHNGSVWPHDNSLVAHGLARYGFRDEANRVALALISASRHFDYRLPEVFAGYDRAVTDFPVEYPTSCSPQAWAAGTVVLLVRTMLGLEPESGALKVDPVPPESISRLRIEDVPAFGALHDIGTD